MARMDKVTQQNEANADESVSVAEEVKAQPLRSKRKKEPQALKQACRGAMGP